MFKFEGISRLTPKAFGRPDRLTLSYILLNSSGRPTARGQKFALCGASLYGSGAAPSADSLLSHIIRILSKKLFHCRLLSLTCTLSLFSQFTCLSWVTMPL